MLSGYISAVITPFKNNEVDLVAFEKYISYLINSGISGIVVCGSTGESLSLSFEEKVKLLKIAFEINNGKTKIIGGIIDSSTNNCLELMKKTEKYVDNFLCICPFYVKPSQQQIYEHFKRLSENTSKGIIIYNNPQRVGTDIGFDTFQKLCAIKNIVAIKECSNILSRFSLWRKDVKEEFSFLSGNDDTACAALAMGANGIISVTANIAPTLSSKMYKAFFQNSIEKFCILRDILAPLHELMFAEPSPAPLKYALSRAGLIANELRNPLSQISPDLQKKIDNFMEKQEIT
ncbi:MAG: 4-hydroxy-tetrahydrodipicolinate synthase [Holosporaceae bacterium]|nr:4-hydroxy-tetrahydrodipicolinate synthase [Holosporaceae bacterium]